MFSIPIEEIVMNINSNPLSASRSSVGAAALAMLAVLAGNPPAQAAEPLTHVVSYADLDLNSRAGAEVLYVRLRSAAREVCSPFESSELSRHVAWQTCIDRSLSSAVAQLNKPLVTALQSRTVNGGRTIRIAATSPLTAQ
jgi:UrcA family protein